MGEIDVLAIGELNPDLILASIEAATPQLGVEQAFSRPVLTLGSSTAITCVLLRRLGHRSALAAWVGDDDHGAFCRHALTADGVDVSQVRIDPQLPTGLTVCLPYPSDRMLLTCKGTMIRNPADGIDGDLLRRTRHIHVGSFFLQDTLRPAVAGLFAAAQEMGLTTSLDTGWDPAERWLDDDLRAALAYTSVFLPNLVEFEAISGETDVVRGMEALLALGVDAVALKRGVAGAAHADKDGIVEAPGFAAVPVDTTGAGDAFNAGYLSAMLAGRPPRERLGLGNACGALTVAEVGGTGGIIDAEQVRAFQSARMLA